MPEACNFMCFLIGKSAFAWDMVLCQWMIVALCFESAWSSWKGRHLTPSDVVPLPRRAGTSTAALQKTEHLHIIGSCAHPSVHLYYLWNYSKDFNIVDYDIYTKTCQVKWILIIPFLNYYTNHCTYIKFTYWNIKNALTCFSHKTIIRELYIPC